jgi:hypothetical protein
MQKPPHHTREYIKHPTAQNRQTISDREADTKCPT